MNTPICCNYGLNKIYRAGGFPVGYRIRTPEREVFYVGPCGKGIPLFARRLPQKFRDAEKLNEQWAAGNSEVLRHLSKDRPIILYVLDALIETGGVERRFAMQFDWLMRHGIQPVLLIEEQGYEPLRKYPCIRLMQSAPNAAKTLLEIVRQIRPLAVEFNMKGAKFFHDADLDELKKYTRVGAMLHGKVDAAQERLDRADYRCSVRLHEMPYRHLDFVPNVVRFPTDIPAYRPEAKKALYIGRIDEEKLPTVKSFVEVCRRYGMDYEIAGFVHDVFSVKRWAKSQAEGVLIGVINTREHLREHGHDYAFIGGVGQVVLEACASNLPCLVATHQTDPMRSAFVTKENLERLLEWNCVLRACPEEVVAGNVKSFFNARKRALSGEERALDDYFVRGRLMELRSEDEVWTKYLRLVEGRVS